MFGRKDNAKPLIHQNPPEWGGRLDPYVTAHKYVSQWPAKEVRNLRSEMNLLHLYTHELKFEDTGNVCRECVNFYFDALSRTGGRCKARGFLEVNAETLADHKFNYTDPSGNYFQEWPECPLFTVKIRLSRR